jgi:hypothetical protein
MELSDSDLDNIVKEYLKRPDLKENDDPLSHAARLVAAAYEMPGVRAIQPEVAPWSPPPEKITYVEYVRAVAEYLHAINPTLSFEEWARLYAMILGRCFPGAYVRIRKRPKLAKMIDATLMSEERWRAKYKGSRANFYKLRQDAHEMKVSDAIRSRPNG